ncbi:MAG: alpha-xylosidase [Clostridia bacterium]|nr:alpha-xylosidase [Clostridia bacterium]
MLDAHLIAKTRPQVRPENVVLFGDFRISVLADRLFRIEKDEKREFCDEATEAVWFRDMLPVFFTTKETEDGVDIKTKRVTLSIKTNFEESFILLDGKKRLLNNEGNLLGTISTLDRCNGDEYIESDNVTFKKIKLGEGVLSKNGVAVLDYTNSSVLTKDGMIRKERNDSLDIYVFAYGHDYRAAIRAFYMICGETPRIPRYAFGNWWSRYCAYTEEEYINVMDRMEDRDIPLTVATVDMDWHWSRTLDKVKKITESGKNTEFYGGKSGWTGYSWNTDLFPDYKRFLKRLHDKGLRVTLNLHPATGVRYFEDMYEEMATAMGIDPKTEECVRIDFLSDRFINAYFKILHKPYEHDGVDFWWIDWQQGPRAKAKGIDIMWVLNHYHTLDNAKEHTPLILSRYSGIGAHRYPLGFSGDTMVTWKTLAYLPYFTANASNIGFTWWSHDIGGHFDGEKNDELYVRSVQFGVFSPINRLHCTNMPFMTKEPSYYMNGTGYIAEEFLRLRHKMIPFIDSASVDTSEKGIALIEPMYYEYPEQKEAYDFVSQYMFGGQLLVAPVITPGDGRKMAKTAVWLPEGTWTDIFTGNTYSGGRTVDMVRHMDSIPVLAKEGGFFVLDGRKHTNDISFPDVLDVMTFNGNGEYTLHEYGEQGRMNTRFVSEQKDGKQKLTIIVSGDPCVVTRKMRLEFRNIQKGTVTVYADGILQDASVKTDAYIIVALPDVRHGSVYTVEVEPMEDAGYFHKRIVESLTRIECGNVNKQEFLRSIWEKTEEEVLELIRNSNEFSENEKIYLTEEW